MVDKDQGAPLPQTAGQQNNSAGPISAAPAASSGINNRKNPRRRVLKEGKVIFAKGHCILDCTIDNVSDGGAHIRITSSHGVPPEFYLAEATRGIIHKAEVMWRTPTGMGLKILGPIEDATQREAFLRKFRR
jgi:PilZ domain